jgi:hypothetical protein
MKALKNIIIAAAALAALFTIVGLFLPNTWEVSKSISMSASKEKIYTHVADFHNWLSWSPWNDAKDTSLSYSYEGPTEGIGAQQNWTSDKMGSGWLKLTEANPQTGIKYDLFIDMGRFQSSFQGELAFETEGEQTKVTWTDRGDNGNSLVRKWMSLSLGSMLGKDMLAGLNNLKALVEKADLDNQEEIQEKLKEEVIEEATAEL